MIRPEPQPRLRGLVVEAQEAEEELVGAVIEAEEVGEVQIVAVKGATQLKLHRVDLHEKTPPPHQRRRETNPRVEEGGIGGAVKEAVEVGEAGEALLQGQPGHPVQEPLAAT